MGQWTYSRAELWALQSSAAKSISLNTLHTLREFDICRTPSTRRGTRAGIGKQRSIKVVTGTGFCKPKHKGKAGSNQNNLIALTAPSNVTVMNTLPQSH